MYQHPYSQITVETEFDNPLYETGGVRVSSVHYKIIRCYRHEIKV